MDAPLPILFRRTEVFISASTADLKSTRAIVKQAVDTIGCHGVYQEEFPPDYRKVDEMLRSRIADCEAVIHIVGACYGSEPRDRPPNRARRSYTQMEYDIAQDLGRPLYVFVCAEGYPYDGHSPEPDDVVVLQKEHREACLGRSEIWEKVSTPNDLKTRISQLQVSFKKLARQIIETSRAVSELGEKVEATAKEIKSELGTLSSDIYNLATSKGDIRRILTVGPKLKPLSIPVGGEPGLLHSDRRVKFVCRDTEIRELEAFLSGSQRVAWQLWLGAAGMGKTRLAFEFCRQVDRSWDGKPSVWTAGFLDFRRVAISDWSDWKPSNPTLIVVDYVEEHANEVSTFIEQSAQSAQRHSFPKVRFLLLNRDRDSKWYEAFYGHDEHTSWLASTAFVASDGQDRSEQILKPFDRTDLGHVVTAIIEARGSRGEMAVSDGLTSTADQIVAKFAQVTFELRPLFVSLATESVLEGRDLVAMSHESLARDAIRHEIAMWRKYFPPDEQGDSDLTRHATLVALATSTEGFELPNGYRRLHKRLAEHSMDDFIPPAGSFANHYDTLEKFYSLGRDGSSEGIPALRPDYIGELFVLDHLQSRLKNPSAQRAFVSATLTIHPEGVLAFWYRAVQNHRRHPSIPLLLERVLEVTKNRAQPWPCRFGFGSVEQNMGLFAGLLDLPELESAFYDAAVAADVVSVSVLFTVAEYRWKKHRDLRGATELLARAMTMEHVQAPALVNAAVLLARELNDKEGAKALLYRIMTLERADTVAIVDAASVLARELDDKPAAKQLLMRLNTMEGVTEHALVGGTMFLARELGDKDAAKQLLTRLEKAKVTNIQAIVEFASLLARELDDKPAAKQLLMRLNTMEGVTGYAIVRGAKLLARELDDKPAAKQLLTLLEKNPNTKRWHWNKAAKIAKFNLMDEALEKVYLRRAADERNAQETKLLAQIERGQIHKGRVKHIGAFGAIIALGGIDGVLYTKHMSWNPNSNPLELIKIGEEIEVYIINVNKELGKIVLGLKQGLKISWKDVITHYPIDSRHTGKVVNVKPYGAFVNLEPGIEGLVHISEMSWTKRIKHPNELVSIGDQFQVKVLSINEDKQEIALSIKQVQPNPWDKIAERYPSGTQVEGIIHNLTSYGAFIEIEEGIVGLLHVSNMSLIRKVDHPSDVLSKGDKIKCIVLSVDQDKQRIVLGLKQMADNP